MYVVIIHFGELSCIPLDWLYIYMYLTNHHSFFHHFFFNMCRSHRQLLRLPKFTILYQIFRMQETTYQQTNTRIFLENMISFFRRFLLKRVLIKFSFFLNYRQIWNRNASLFYWKRNNIPKKKGEKWFLENRKSFIWSKPFIFIGMNDFGDLSETRFDNGCITTKTCKMA